MPKRKRPFSYAAFASDLYRKHLPLDLRLDLQQWFTMVQHKKRGAFGCKDPKWMRIAVQGSDHIDNITGVVGCAVCLLTSGHRNASQSSLLEDMLVQELLSTQWLTTPEGLHNIMSYTAVNDDRLAFICKFTLGSRRCGKLVHCAPPTKWIGPKHPHPTNHFIWREGKTMKKRGGLNKASHKGHHKARRPFAELRGLNPHKNYYQCCVHGNMKEYHHPSGQWSASRHFEKAGRQCPGRLCDLVPTENYWTWKTFIKYLVTDKHHTKALARFYKVAVLNRARAIQATWRGYFARSCIVPFTQEMHALPVSPTDAWTSRITKEYERRKRWFEFLVKKRRR